MIYRDDLIRAKMGARRETNHTLAQKTGLSATTISFIRNGHSKVVLENLARVADVLQIEMRDLFTFDQRQAAA